MKPSDSYKIVRSHAKVNLTLDVLDRRPDGFHNIESVVQTISLHDLITISISDTPGIRISCTLPVIPVDESNLAYRAASAFQRHVKSQKGIDIHIDKRIPPNAGMGGGSSNAAAVLQGLGRLLSHDIPSKELCEIADGIGSDVPFFLSGGTALVRGKGEIVQPLADIRSWWIIIVKPSFGISTPWAYTRLDEIRGKKGKRQIEKSVTGKLTNETGSSRLVRCINETRCENLPELISNDLEIPVIEQHPEIQNIKNCLLCSGARGTLMCGSGSAVFGLYDDETSARSVYQSCSHMGDIFVESFGKW